MNSHLICPRMPRHCKIAALAGTVLALSAGTANAVPTQWAGNGHWYEVVVAVGGIDWESAQAAAVAQGGYLATLTSDAENAFAFTLADAAPSAWLVFGGPFGEVGGPWLGGFQPPNSPEPTGNWTWNNGEGSFSTPGYTTNWIANSPNNLGGNENRIQFYGLNLQRSALWNDNNNAALLAGYVIEWNTAPVPEPGSLLTMIGGLGALLLLARRRQGPAFRMSEVLRVA